MLGMYVIAITNISTRLRAIDATVTAPPMAPAASSRLWAGTTAFRVASPLVTNIPPTTSTEHHCWRRTAFGTFHIRSPRRVAVMIRMVAGRATHNCLFDVVSGMPSRMLAMVPPITSIAPYAAHRRSATK